MFDKLDHETAIALINPSLEQLTNLIQTKLGLKTVWEKDVPLHEYKV